MASPQKPTSTATGYFTYVSPIKISKKNNPYFNCKFQTSKDSIQDVVCYSKDKHPQISASTLSGLPVKLTNIQSLASSTIPSQNDIHISRHSTIEVLCSTSVDFDKNDFDATMATPMMSISDIAKLGNKHQVSVQGKVTHISGIKQKDVFDSIKRTQSVTIADETGSINVLLWESQVDTLQLGSSYRITPVSTRDYEDNGVISLTTTPNSDFTSVPDIVNARNEPCSSAVPYDVDTCEVTSIQITHLKKCVNCKRPINDERPKNNVVCPACGMTMRIKQLTQSTTAVIVLKVEGTTKRLQCSQDVLEDFLDNIGQPSLLHKKGLLPDKFLGFAALTFTSTKGKLIKIAVPAQAPAARPTATSSATSPKTPTATETSTSASWDDEDL